MRSASGKLVWNTPTRLALRISAVRPSAVLSMRGATTTRRSPARNSGDFSIPSLWASPRSSCAASTPTTISYSPGRAFPCALWMNLVTLASASRS